MLPEPSQSQRLTAAVAIAVALFVSGCKTVEPWERAHFSDYLMRSDRDPLTLSLEEHIYFTREGAVGGRGVPGSGCGCN